MKTLKFIAYTSSMLLIVFMVGHMTYLYSFKPTEQFAEDNYLFNRKGNALLITAHDDDILAMSGTVARLTQNGWNTKHLYLNPGDSKRVQAHQKAASFILDSAVFINIGDKAHRYTPDSIQYQWMPILKELFDQYYEIAIIKEAILAEIESFYPDVVFTLDHEIGGYGHPDHIMISQVVFELLKEKSGTVKYIYQSVFPDSYEKKIMDRMRNRTHGYPMPYDSARKLYEIEGMPEPNVQIEISDYSWEKKMFLSSYLEKEQRNIRKFIPFYGYYPHWFYFNVFDYEYFRIVELQ